MCERDGNRRQRAREKGARQTERKDPQTKASHLSAAPGLPTVGSHQRLPAVMIAAQARGGTTQIPVCRHDKKQGHKVIYAGSTSP